MEKNDWKDDMHSNFFGEISPVMTSSPKESASEQSSSPVERFLENQVRTVLMKELKTILDAMLNVMKNDQHQHQGIITPERQKHVLVPVEGKDNQSHINGRKANHTDRR